MTPTPTPCPRCTALAAALARYRAAWALWEGGQTTGTTIAAMKEARDELWRLLDGAL